MKASLLFLAFFAITLGHGQIVQGFNPYQFMNPTKGTCHVDWKLDALKKKIQDVEWKCKSAFTTLLEKINSNQGGDGEEPPPPPPQPVLGT